MRYSWFNIRKLITLLAASNVVKIYFSSILIIFFFIVDFQSILDQKKYIVMVFTKINSNITVVHHSFIYSKYHGIISHNNNSILLLLKNET